MKEPQDERSLGDVFTDLSRDFSTLVRQEITLAKTELNQKMTRLGKDMASLAIGGFIAYAGLLTLLAAAVFGLAEAIPLWLSALIVAAVVLLVGFVLVQRGLRDLQKGDLGPAETIESLKEDRDFLKEELK